MAELPVRPTRWCSRISSSPMTSIVPGGSTRRCWAAKPSSPGEPTYVALGNSRVIINVGGGPTDDKPDVTLETPRDLDPVSSFLNIRVADIQRVYGEWSARGAVFLTPPKQHETEIRCYLRDPDGYLIEVGQTTTTRGWRPPAATTRGASP